MMDGWQERLGQRIAYHAREVQEMFKPGVKVTIIVRNPMLGDGDCIITEDDLDAVIGAVQRLKDRDEIIVRAPEVGK